MHLSRFIATRLALGKHKTFASLIIKLAWFGVGLSVAVMLIALAIVVGYKQQITQKITGFGGHIEIHSIGTSGNYDYEQFEDTNQFVKTIKQLESVSAIFPILSRPAIMKTDDNLEGIVFKGVNSMYDWSYLEQHLLRGYLPAVSDSLRKREVLISKIIADRLQLDTGDRVKVYFINQPVRVIPCTITGIYETGLEENDKIFVIGSLLEMQRIFANKKPQITHYELKVKELEGLEATHSAINELLPVELSAESIMDLNPQLFDWLGYLDQNIVIILTLMIVVACINMITALLILIIERTNMIGILKALGSRDSVIKKIFLNHAFYILLMGLLFGNVLGIGLCELQDKYKIIKLSQETYYLSYVPVSLSLQNILFVNIGTIIICMIALFLPVRMVNKIDPVKAIKFN